MLEHNQRKLIMHHKDPMVSKSQVRMKLCMQTKVKPIVVLRKRLSVLGVEGVSYGLRNQRFNVSISPKR